MLAAAANSGVRAEDEYSSAEASSLDPSDPPATSTSPFRSIVAECPTRAVERLGPLDTVPAAGSTISLEFRICLLSDPPTIMTRPSHNSTAAWFLRELVRVPASQKERVPRLKISTDASGSPELAPPAIKMAPSCNKAAEAPVRACAMLPAGAHVPLRACASGEPRELPAITIIHNATAAMHRNLETIWPPCVRVRKTFASPIMGAGTGVVNSSNVHALELI